jgi:hypothetical protein
MLILLAFDCAPDDPVNVGLACRAGDFSGARIVNCVYTSAFEVRYNLFFLTGVNYGRAGSRMRPCLMPLS